MFRSKHLLFMNTRSLSIYQYRTCDIKIIVIFYFQSTNRSSNIGIKDFENK